MKKINKDITFNLIDFPILKGKQTTLSGAYEYIKAAELIEGSPNIIMDEVLSELGSNGYQFNLGIAASIRTHFLSKTSEGQTFKTMEERLFNLLSKRINKKNLSKIKRAMSKAEARLLNSEISVIRTKSEDTQGTIKNLTKDDYARLRLKDSDLIWDTQSDNHDLLALVNLISILDGGNISPISIGFGFFLKYMPELKEEGVESILFEIKEGILHNIIISTLEKHEQINFSPVEAALHLTENIKDDCSYIVLVDGMVAGNSDLIYEYEKVSFNDLRIPAGEAFLFENDKSTRLYFTPYSYEHIPFFHSHGSVIFGNNTQSYHSCHRSAEYLSNEEMLAQQFVKEKNMDCVEVSFLNKYLTDPNSEFIHMAKSMFYPSDITIHTEIYLLFNKGNFIHREELLYKLLENFKPITHRFDIYKFKKEFKLEDCVETFYDIVHEESKK